MNILIDIGHPAHVHLFKNIALNLQKKGHVIIFAVRSGEKETQLLSKYGFQFRLIGYKRHSHIGKLFGFFFFTLKILILSTREDSDIYISHSSVYSGFAASIRRKPHIALEDSGNMEQLRLSIPLSSVVVSPDILKIEIGGKHITYKGYHELAYLSPKYFNPDPDIKSLLGLDINESYCIIRFIAWRASHDIHQLGLSHEYKEKILKLLSSKFRVFICSEEPLPTEFSQYEFPLNPEKLHDALSSAEIVISEGATIAAESGVLGIPSIYVNSIERCYNEDLGKYGLVYNYRNPEGVCQKINEILAIPDYKLEFQKRRDKMLQDKIDVTSFLIWLIENYPKSLCVIKDNPDYQLHFKSSSSSN